ncbi:DUF6325 family protein [Ornithinimicrobium sp. LYQ103]|uniref:DUF6325 family protein n=1 Tax=Ornithinimicrobium sp. LYQ103 TaxID=3378796 RepID=UPI003851D03B
MATTTDGDRLGPVELLVIEFPRGQVSGAGFATMTELVDRGVIAVLDLEFVRRTEDGAIELVDVADAVADAPDDLGYLLGASSGLLDPDDIATVGESIEPGCLAGVLVFEHVWILPMADAVQAGGARVLAAARVDPADLVAALDRLEADDPADPADPRRDEGQVV